MRITATQKPPSGRERRRRSALFFAALLVGVVAWSTLAFLGGMAFLDYIRPALQNLTGATSTSGALSSVVAAPRHAIGSLFDAETPESLVIDVKFRHLTKLEEKRTDALEEGILMASSDDLVPAEIRHRDRTVRVKVRLKGDYVDHFESDKWSLRVQTRSGDQILGMRRFSIQAPRTRGFQGEPVVMAHLRREGVLTPRYFFVDVTLNGKDLGLMALEEHFSKELLESQQRREGVIIRFDEDAFFGNKLQTGVHGPHDNPRVAPITPFRSSKVEEDPRLSRQLEASRGMLRAYLQGSLPAAEVFDVDLVARFLAVAEIWRAQHLVRWHNLRFYFNPITQRLEPVAFDANLQAMYLGAGLVTLNEEFWRGCLEDPEIRRAFLAHLHRIANELVEGDLGDWIREVEAPPLAILQREFPFRAALDLEPVIRRAAGLRGIREESFEHHSPWGAGALLYAQPVRAYQIDAAEGPRVELENALPVPVEVSDLHFTGGDAAAPSQLPGARPIRLPPTPLGGRPLPVSVPFTPPEGEFEIAGVARVAGQAHAYPLRAMRYSPAIRGSSLPRASREEALAAHPFLRWDAEDAGFRIAPGVHRVAGSLVLPEGAALRIDAGTRLRFGPGELLLASGPVALRGRVDAPVVLEPWVGTETWGGVVVLSSATPYAWEHAEVRSTSGVDRGSWVLTGGVTLRDSQVSLSHVLFVGNRTEDALNLVRCRFVMRDVDIEDTPSDALDADFSQGEIHGGRMSRIGGDGIDVSGAEIVVEGTRIDEVRDKAISVGEGSRLEARGVHISRTGTALASKDRSEAAIVKSKIEDVVHVALMAYVKKPEYGPASIRAEELQIERVPRDAVAQTGSRIAIDGREVETEDVDVDSLYQGGYMRK